MVRRVCGDFRKAFWRLIEVRKVRIDYRSTCWRLVEAESPFSVRLSEVRIVRSDSH